MKAIVDHTDKKILKRLTTMAMSSLGDNCLLEFNKLSDPIWSANFHYLNRECLMNWGQMFKQTHPNFARAAQKLQVAKRIPIEKRFWDYPDSLLAQNALNDTHALEGFIDQLKRHRLDIKNYVLGNDFEDINDPNLKYLVHEYHSQANRINADEKLKKIKNMSEENLTDEEKKFSQIIGQENLFCEQFINVYEGSLNDSSPREFLNKYEGINRAILEEDDFNVWDKIASLEQKSAKNQIKNQVPEELAIEHSQEMFIREKNTAEDLRKSDNNQKSNIVRKPESKVELPEKQVEPSLNFRPTSNVLKDNSFNLPHDLKINRREMDDDFSNEDIRREYPQLMDRIGSQVRIQKIKGSMPDLLKLKPIDPNSDRILQENEDLIIEIKALETKKRLIEEKVRETGRSNQRSSKLISSYNMHQGRYESGGLYNIMKSQDQQIERLDSKLKRLEGEFNKVSNWDQSFDPNPSSRKMFAGGKDNTPMVFKLHQDPIKHSSYRKIVLDKKFPLGSTMGSYKTSVFVDQLYNDINRVLSKPSKFPKRTIISPVN